MATTHSFKASSLSCVRRHEKQIPTNNSRIIIENPLALLKKAFELDGPSFYLQPLESIRLHAVDDDEFHRTVRMISSSHPKVTRKPVTPVILAGLLKQESNSRVEYIHFIRTLRTQAIQRQLRTRRRYQWIIAIFFSLTIIVILSYILHSLADLLNRLQSMGFLGFDSIRPCYQFDSETRRHCSRRDARLWLRLQDTYRVFSPGIVCRHGRCPSKFDMEKLITMIQKRSSELKPFHAPYALHTIVAHGFRKSKKKPPQDEEPLRWLGNSRLAQLVVQHIGKRPRVLEIGAGLGNLLYALLPHPRKYTGLELSPASIGMAMKISEYHGLGNIHRSVRFSQENLDTFLESTRNERYDAIVVIEYLSYYTTSSINDVVEGLSMLLRPGGRLILVDDVINSPRDTQKFSALPDRQLVTHENVTTSLARWLTIVEQRDLGLEFSLPQLESSKAMSYRHGWLYRIWNCFLSWIQPYVPKDFPYIQRLLELFPHIMALQQADLQRMMAHQNAELLYVMYVAQKPKGPSSKPPDSAATSRCSCQPEGYQSKSVPEACRIEK
jgi:SAM-dependent methyltransferase